MNKVTIKKIGIINTDCEAVVNAANNHLAMGGGVCGIIFSAAGASELTRACDKIGYCKTGEAVITPGFNLKFKYIIHAVGPIYKDGKHEEDKLLYNAYSNSLKVAKENGVRSIAFPLISAGIFGYPKKEAWEIALKACKDFLKNNEMDIVFTIIDDNILNLGLKIYSEVFND